MRALRNLAILAAVAAVIVLAPGGGAAVATIFTAITMLFLWALATFVYRFYRENDLTIATLSEGRRAILLGGIGMIALLIAGSPKLFSTPEGKLLWFVLIAVSLVAIVRTWLDANSYT